MQVLDAGAGVAVPDLTEALVRRTAVTLAAAEAAGIARWCLETAVDYAKVREQFGQKIGGFQAIKHLCAEMLETAEAVTAAAWDVASVATAATTTSGRSPPTSPRSSPSTARVEVAKDCIQVLGGIGFTYEHDAHLYLRRALACAACSATATRPPSGSRPPPSTAYADACTSTSRAATRPIRAEVRATVDGLAALPAEERRAGVRRDRLPDAALAGAVRPRRGRRRPRSSSTRSWPAPG